MSLNTAFLLMAQYNGLAIIPLDVVCKDYFRLTPDRFLRKVAEGKIKIPVVRLGDTQKAAKGIHLKDLAAYLDERREAAAKECAAINS